MALHFTDDTFKVDELQSEVPVLVDFWAEWCGPCRAIAPMIDELANEFEGKVKVGKVNIDDNPEIAATFGIRSIPTLLVFKNGKVVEQMVGARPKPQLASILEAHSKVSA